MIRRLLPLLVSMLALTACGGSDEAEVPDDQELRPAAAPDGWEVTDLGPVSVATPPEWTNEGTDELDGISGTMWRQTPAGQPDAGYALAGLQVRVIDSPQQDAEKAATAQGIDAMATMGADAPEPEELVWPGARSAYLLELDTELEDGPEGPGSPYTTWIVVYDLENEQQVQVTAIVAEGEDTAVPEQALASVELDPEVEA